MKTYMEKEVNYLNLFGTEVKMLEFIAFSLIMGFMIAFLLISLWVIFAKDRYPSDKFGFGFIGLIAAFVLFSGIFWIDHKEIFCRPEMRSISGEIVAIDKEKNPEFKDRIKVSLQTEGSMLIEVFLLEDFFKKSDLGLGDHVSGKTFAKNIVLEKTIK